MFSWKPGIGTLGEPALIGSPSRPRGLAQMAQPVSVCHQWSTTGTPRIREAQWKVSVSSRSPAANRVRRLEMSYLSSSFASGSAFRMARSAVGAVNSTLTLWSWMTRQNAPASGVPTGLPS